MPEVATRYIQPIEVPRKSGESITGPGEASFVSDGFLLFLISWRNVQLRLSLFRSFDGRPGLGVTYGNSTHI